jgi:uncharacterized protein (TIGR02391 family)
MGSKSAHPARATRVSAVEVGHPLDRRYKIMEKVPPFGAQHLTSIAKILADTESGLTGSQIGYLLQDCKIPDVSPTMTKWKRLFNAFVGFQNQRRFGNHVVVFISRAMNPVQYTSRPDVFAQRRDELNTVLAFSGMYLGDDGKVRWSTRAEGLQEAMRRASRLHSALVTRNVHNDVLQFCKAELLHENYFHAVFEAMKSIAAKIRKVSGLTCDGAELVQQAFGLGKDCTPLLAINPLATETDKGEQRGFVNLLVGLFGTIRNPTAHNPKIEWDMTERDALDVLTIASLIHRKLDKAYKYCGSNS